MTIPVKLTTHFNSLSAGFKTASDSSSHPDAENTSPPTFTPSETPPQIPSPILIEFPDLENLESAKMEESKDGAAPVNEEAKAIVTGNSATQTETKMQDPGDLKVKKAVCRKHNKASKKSKKKSKAKAEASSSSEDSSSSSSSSSSGLEESTESESSSEEDSDVIRKKKQKAKKAKKLKEKKKAKLRKHKEASEEDSDAESSDESSSEEEEKKKKFKSKKSRRSKKHRKEEESSEEEEDPADPLAGITKAHMLNFRRMGRRARGGHIALDNRIRKKSLGSKSKGKKKKR